MREFAEQMPEPRRPVPRRCWPRTRSSCTACAASRAVDEQTLLDLGVTGPLLRATGNSWDLRKAAPYSSYEDFEFKIPVGTTGDNWDRFAVRARR